MSEDSPELTRAREVAVKLESLEKNCGTEPELWEQYLSDCIRAYTRHVREKRIDPEATKEVLGAVAERRGYISYSVDHASELSLADRMSIAEVLVDLSQQGISLPEYSIRKENK